MMYFGQKIKALRNEKDISEAELGKTIGVSRPTISLYESGGSYPSIKRLIKLAKYFNVATDYLLGITDASEKFNYTGLTDQQTLAVQELIRQFELANSRIAPADPPKPTPPAGDPAAGGR